MLRVRQGSMAGSSSPASIELRRYIVFSGKRIGKKNRRYVNISLIYTSEPKRGLNPVFEARVDRDYTIAFLNSISAPYRVLGDNLVVIEGSDPDTYLRRLVVYSGVRQFTTPSSPILTDIVTRLSEIEALFWYSKLTEAYEDRGYWGVYRVAKAFRTLYRI